MEWICNQCNAPAASVDADILYREMDGLSDALVCEQCREWWFTAAIAKKIAKVEARIEAKMS